MDKVLSKAPSCFYAGPASNYLRHAMTVSIMSGSLVKERDVTGANVQHVLLLVQPVVPQADGIGESQTDNEAGAGHVPSQGAVAESEFESESTK